MVAAYSFLAVVRTEGSQLFFVFWLGFLSRSLGLEGAKGDLLGHLLPQATQM